MKNQESENRRPVKSRTVLVFHRIAFFLVSVGLTPNMVSVLSAVFASLGALSLILSQRADGSLAKIIFLVGTFLGIQLRLTCNLVDGLMAVEGGKKTPYGEFFNDFPDRVSDLVLILAVGLSLSQQSGQHLPMHLAWIAAVFAVLTAYIRVLGASMKAPHFFLGPMAKQHRMAMLNLALVGSLVEVLFLGYFFYSFALALVIIALGALITCVRRAAAIIRFFQASQPKKE